MNDGNNQKIGGFDVVNTGTPRSYNPNTSKMVRWVMKYSGGLVKDERQANYILIGFIVVMIIITFVVLSNMGGEEATYDAPPGKRYIFPTNEPPRLQDL